MPSYHILRNGQRSGPYDTATLQHYVQSAQILLQDTAINAATDETLSVREALQRQGLRARPASNGGLLLQVRALGLGLALPRAAFSWSTFRQDQKLLLLSIVGLAPAFLIPLTGGSSLTFYAIALYFSLLWGIFFYYMFRTPQVSYKTAALIFGATQLIILITVGVFNLPHFNPFYRLIDSSSFVLRLLGFVLGVGLFEETLKALPLLLIGYRSRQPLVPQTLVFYGLISGIGFGVLEGVQYQLTVNAKLDYNAAFFLNIARLTCLPFLHAIWAGIAGYFISLSFLFPLNRIGLRVFAIGIPALLHGLYDSLGWSIPGLLVCYAGVGLLIIYLKRSRDFQQKLGR